MLLLKTSGMFLFTFIQISELDEPLLQALLASSLCSPAVWSNREGDEAHVPLRPLQPNMRKK